MGKISIDAGRCNHCGICTVECPLRLITLDKNKIPSFSEGLAETCVGCGHCMAVCPQGALSLNDVDPAASSKQLERSEISAEKIKNFLLSRRSVRNYKKDPVPREVLAKVIDVARYAPTGGNSQRVQWAVLYSHESVRHVAGLTIDYIDSQVKSNAPMAINYRLDRMVDAWKNGEDGIFRGAPAVVIAHAPSDYRLAVVDCTIALTFLELAAFPLGLGTCWAGFFMQAANAWEPLRQYLSLPEGNGCYGAMMIGYPKYDYFRIPRRKDAAITWK